jgi:CRISPR-associated protein Csb3
MKPEPSIRVNVDVTNPGQFFACCGLLELADRLWPGAEGWFEEGVFCVTCDGTLFDILSASKVAQISGDGDEAVSDDNEADSDEPDSDEDSHSGKEDGKRVMPVVISAPFNITLDWWSDSSIKPWAGSMNVHMIARAMARVIDPYLAHPFSQHEVVMYSPGLALQNDKSKNKKPKKREPFYFDSLRGPNSHPRDVGFSTNKLKMTTAASPVVELLSLIGLQRCRPRRTQAPRQFDYFTWNIPLMSSVAPVSVIGHFARLGGSGYRFINAFRSDQKKLKAYLPAVPLFRGERNE